MRDNKPILLVEDDDVDAETVQRGLRQLHVTNPLVHVAHGREALAWLRQPGNPTPGLIGLGCLDHSVLFPVVGVMAANAFLT